MEDKKLVKMLKEKDPKGYEVLYTEYSQKIYGVLKNYVRPSEMEDAIQEVFVKVYKGINNFKELSKLSTWIYKIAVNVGRNFLADYRKSKEDPYDLNNESDESPVRAISEYAVDTSVSDMDYEMIINIMNELNEEDRLIIQLRDIEEMSYDEISKITEKPIGSVKSRLHYARKKLQMLLEEANLV